MALKTDILNPIVVGESEKGKKENKSENKAYAKEEEEDAEQNCFHITCL